MKRIRAILNWVWRVAAGFTWWALGLWTVLATFYTAPGPAWVAYILPLGIAALYFVARRERFRLLDWRALTWREKRFSTLAIASTAIYAVYYFGFIRPDNSQMWALEQDRKPIVEIDGDKVHVQNVRNFTWRTEDDFTTGWYERTYDLSKLTSMYYVVASMPAWEAVAHVFVCFGFSDGQNVAVSVEGHRLKGRPYGVVSAIAQYFRTVAGTG